MDTMNKLIQSKLKFMKEWRKEQKGNNNYTRKLDAQIEMLEELLKDA